ncbi:ABC transporter permease [Luteococcus sp. Sow4_B9]|uniref:ABC transporter permease n=1 Tax=Luteococcus sp. Sow4_B9 TaxID=3438792 RepID=UPI003F97579D
MTATHTIVDSKVRHLTDVAHRESRGRRRRGIQDVTLQVGVLVFFIAVWWIVAAAHWVSPQYLPSPASVGKAFLQANTCRDIGDGQTACGEQNYYLWEHLLVSLNRIGVGVALAMVVGLLFGFALGMVRPLRIALSPMLNFVRALPPLGYAGLVIVWVGIGAAAKIWLLFLAAFPPIAISAMQGVSSVSPERLQAAQSMGATRLQIWRYVVLPHSLESIVQGLRLAVGFAWTTVVAAELNNGIPGIGGLAYFSGTRLQTPLTLACVITIGLVAVALDWGIARVGTALVPWKGGG